MKKISVKTNPNGRRNFKPVYDALEESGEVYVEADRPLRAALQNRLTNRYYGSYSTSSVQGKDGELKGVEVRLI